MERKERLMKKTFALFLAVMLTLCMLAGCSQEKEDSSQRTLYYCLSGDINSADPNYRTLTVEHNLYRQIYEPLYFVNHDTGEMENRLAESYQVSDDGLTYTFVIKKGVKFHDGTEVKASDVAFTVEQAAASSYIGTTVANFKSAKATDDYTVEIQLTEPFASFLENVVQLYILPKAYYESVGADGFAEKPIGCGPYKMTERVVGSSIKLEAFEDYYRGVAPIKNVEMRIFSDTTASAVALETGEVNIMDINSANYAKFDAMDSVNIYECKSPHITCVHMNSEVYPFDDVRVRQAVNYCVNRAFMVEVAMDGLAEETSNIVSPMMFGYSDTAKTYDYDVEKAKELLAEAGVQTPLNIGKIGATSFGEKIAPILQENLADIGLIADIEVTDTSFIDAACKGNYTIGIMGLVVYNGVAWDMDAYSILFDSSAIDAFNLPRINNPRIDELFKLGRSATDQDKRLAYYQELNDLVQEDSGWVMLYSRYTDIGCTSDLYMTLHSPNVIYFYECSWK